ncbi:MAG: CoxE, partial [Acidobacteriota bacterium]
GGDGYSPIASGVRAVLPHVDDFLPLHNLESLEDLAARLRDLGLGQRRRGGRRGSARGEEWG